MIKNLLVLLIFLFSSLSFAHPHVWIDSKIMIRGDKLFIVWKFDEMFSNIFYADFDVDGDRQFMGMEAKQVKSGMFDNLRDFDYFFKAYCGNALLDVSNAEGFEVKSDKKFVSYKFNINIPIKKCRKQVQIYHYDETLYSEITISKAVGAKIVDDTGGRQYMELK